MLFLRFVVAYGVGSVLDSNHEDHVIRLAITKSYSPAISAFWNRVIKTVWVVIIIVCKIIFFGFFIIELYANAHRKIEGVFASRRSYKGVSTYLKVRQDVITFRQDYLEALFASCRLGNNFDIYSFDNVTGCKRNNILASNVGFKSNNIAVERNHKALNCVAGIISYLYIKVKERDKCNLGSVSEIKHIIKVTYRNLDIGCLLRASLVGVKVKISGGISRAVVHRNSGSRALYLTYYVVIVVCRSGILHSDGLGCLVVGEVILCFICKSICVTVNAYVKCREGVVISIAERYGNLVISNAVVLTLGGIGVYRKNVIREGIEVKNQRLILDAFRLLRDRSDDWLLIMAGSGKDEQDIQRYAASLNLSDRVIFTGLIRDRDLLRGVYLNADLLFFPSVFDNAPLVLREAAVLGVPTLAVEGSNAAGAIRKNVNGFTAADTPKDMSDEIIRIFAEEDVRAIGQCARETIPLSWERLTPMVLDRYRTVIEQFRIRSEPYHG